MRSVGAEAAVLARVAVLKPMMAGQASDRHIRESPAVRQKKALPMGWKAMRRGRPA